MIVEVGSRKLHKLKTRASIYSMQLDELTTQDLRTRIGETGFFAAISSSQATIFHKNPVSLRKSSTDKSLKSNSIYPGGH
ncbi:hypothetical protein MiSe_04600 [Microseira wollei NIES-4236]|uniref:Uncharacterized protein n=1 Tax=Microseira wollei NIES-4236 TaxID=2530354 RepID=A0AAV3X551_9CYAN|nr:hypothetical protein MiSe_04600 [Microseira wollei NIES-4236]